VLASLIPSYIVHGNAQGPSACVDIAMRKNEPPPRSEAGSRGFASRRRGFTPRTTLSSVLRACGQSESSAEILLDPHRLLHCTASMYPTSIAKVILAQPFPAPEWTS